MIAEVVVARKLETTGHEIIKSHPPASDHERSDHGSGSGGVWRSDSSVSMGKASREQNGYRLQQVDKVD